MNVQLRPYQTAAIQACAVALKDEKTALLVLGTGAGKSLVIAGICKRILEKNPKWRVLVLCYIAEVLESNQHACDQMGVDSGVYCAGAGKRDTEHQVIHASRDSMANNPDACGSFEVIIIDEVHAVPDFVSPNSDKKKSRYQTLIEHIGARYVIGTTATPYRLDGGNIFGRRKLFSKVHYSLDMEDLQRMGFLVHFTLPSLKKQIDTSGLKITRGDFDSKQLEELLLRDRRLVEQSLDAWTEHATDRKCSLFFCHSIAHANMCMEIFKEKFPWMPCAYIDGETNKTERKGIVEGIKQGAFVAVFQVNTMTTGVNLPIVDCIVWLRPTMSPVLWVQGNGRGSRLFPDKEDCLVVDTVGNMETFGSITRPFIKGTGKAEKIEFTEEELLEMGLVPGDVKGKAPTKDCVNPKCKVELHAAAKKCDKCGQLQIKEVKIFRVNTEPVEVPIQAVEIFEDWTTKAGYPAVRICYHTKGKTFEEVMRKDMTWLGPKIDSRLALLKKGVAILKVQHNQQAPMYPYLTPIPRPGCNVLPSLVLANKAFYFGGTTPSEFTIQDETPTEAVELEA